MREKHDCELVEARQEVLTKYHVFTLSKQCCTLRAQEKRHFSVKEYAKANDFRILADQMEIEEIQKH